MTKRVRIENADCDRTHMLEIQVWQVGGGMEGEDVLVETVNLDNPCDIVSAYVHSGRYIVIKEKAQ